MKKDVTEWSRTSVQCQCVKVQCHTKTPIASFQNADRLAHLNIDIVGPLSLSKNCRYLLTMIDRVTKWPEAQAIEEITVEKVANALYEVGIARYGCPATITTDRGRKFESELFNKLMHRMGISAYERQHSILSPMA